MIKVFDNGVPLAAIASIEIDPLEVVYRKRSEVMRQTYCNRYTVNFPGHLMRMPLLKLPMSEAEARRLRDEWRKAWPEVAYYWDDK